MRFLFHLAGMRTLNLPFFILKILTKMSPRKQTHVAALDYSIYHQALIKVLNAEELKKRKHSWEHFLFYRAFQYVPTQKIPTQ